MSWRSWGSLALGLAISVPAFGQAGGPPRAGGDRKASGGNQNAPSAVGAPGRPAGPMRLGDSTRRTTKDVRGYGAGRGQEIDKSALDPKRLEEELKLEWRQKEELSQIFREYEAAVRELKQSRLGASSEQEKKRLEQDWKAARQARDYQRAAQVMKELRKYRTSASDEEREYQEMLIEEIEKILDKNQKVQFRRMLRPSRDQGRVTGPLDDPKVLFECLKQVKLQDYQQSQIDRIKRDYENEVKRRGKVTSNEEKMMREGLLREVRMVLNDEQKKDLQRTYDKMRGPGAGGGPIDMTNPMQLQFAIGKLNMTKDRLTPDQNTELTRIRKEYFQELRQSPRGDDMARQQLDQRVAQQVIALLTPAQQDAIKNMEAPAGRRFMRGRRSRTRDRTGGYNERSRSRDDSRRGSRSRSQDRRY